jgi:outer membrane protein assembly factor BamB
VTSRAAVYRRRRLAVLAAAIMLVGLIAALISAIRSDDPADRATSGGGATSSDPADPSKPTTSTTAPIDTSVFSDPARVGMPWGTTVNGLLTFRGNPTRTFYGIGPVPSAPGVAWFTPQDRGMCSESSAGGVTKVWCGAGWTGQPAVFERDGVTWVVFNAYDRAVHFVDADTGEDLLAPFVTGDIIKGSVTVDPDGFPLVYSGSRDNYFRVLAIDRPGGKAVELWKLSADAVSPTLWNNDWDGSALVADDLLIIGGENSQFHVVKLNRRYGNDGLVTVKPKLVFNTPGWDDQLLRDLGGSRARDVSIENSVAVWKDTAYFANSGGLVQGWDLAPLRKGGRPTRTFRFWTGDDTDASVVVDEDGFLYVGVEYERGNARARQVGQLVKLDPRKPDNPIVWSFKDQDRIPAGVWSTVALDRDVLYTTTNGGRLLALDRRDGSVRWTRTLPPPLWQSPVVVDNVLIQGDCNGTLHAFDVSDTTVEPPELWQVRLGGCIEATPAVWKGAIYLATRAGRFFKLADGGVIRSPTAEDRTGASE